MFTEYYSSYGAKPYCLGINVDRPEALVKELKDRNLDMSIEILGGKSTNNYNIKDGTDYNFILTIVSPYEDTLKKRRDNIELIIKHEFKVL